MKKATYINFFSRNSTDPNPVLIITDPIRPKVSDLSGSDPQHCSDIHAKKRFKQAGRQVEYKWKDRQTSRILG